MRNPLRCGICLTNIIPYFLGQLIFCILSVIPKTKEYFQAAVRAYVGCFSDKGIITSGLGTFVLGVGMTLSGAVSTLIGPRRDKTACLRGFRQSETQTSLLSYRDKREN